MAGTTPTAQWSPTQTNPNQPNATQNPYAPTNTGQTGSGAGLTQPGYLSAPSTVGTGQFSPNQTIAEILQGFAPQAQSSENNLNQTLADFGINGGQAVSAMSQLQSQLGSALAPSLASAIQGSQSNLLNAGEFNAGATNAANQYNVGTYNSSQNNMLQDLLNQYTNQNNAVEGIIGSGQGAGNQNAVGYGQEITTQQSPWMSIFQGLMQGAGAAGSAGLFSGAGSSPGYSTNPDGLSDAPNGNYYPGSGAS